MMVQNGVRGERGLLFYIHLVLAVSFLYTLIRLLFINGKRRPIKHRKLVRYNVSFCIGMLVTGIILL